MSIRKGFWPLASGLWNIIKGFWPLASGFKLAALRALRYCLLLTATCQLFNCKRELTDLPIPYTDFPDIVINLNLPQYIELKNDGASIYIDGGVRGIILYRKNSSTYLAYERNCSYQPNEACATVDIDASKFFLIDSCCGSTFNLDDGSPNGAPAWRPLRRYKTYLTGTELTINSESANGM